MAFTKLNDDLNIIAKLSDEPNDADGLSAEQLKAKFDEAGNAIQDYLNHTHLPEHKAENTAVTPFTGVASDNVQDALEELLAVCQNAQLEDVPDNYVPGGKLQDGTVTEEKLGEDVLAALDGKYRPETGDILNTLRTNLGPDWLLCNGGKFDITAYPDLAAMRPAWSFTQSPAPTAEAIFTNPSSGTSDIYTIESYSFTNGLHIIAYKTAASSIKIAYSSSPDGPYTVADYSIAAQEIGNFTYLNGKYVATCATYASSKYSNYVIYSTDIRTINPTFSTLFDTNTYLKTGFFLYSDSTYYYYANQGDHAYLYSSSDLAAWASVAISYSSSTTRDHVYLVNGKVFCWVYSYFSSTDHLYQGFETATRGTFTLFSNLAYTSGGTVIGYANGQYVFTYNSLFYVTDNPFTATPVWTIGGSAAAGGSTVSNKTGIVYAGGFYYAQVPANYGQYYILKISADFSTVESITAQTFIGTSGITSEILLLQADENHFAFYTASSVLISSTYYGYFYKVDFAKIVPLISIADVYSYIKGR